MKTGIVMACGTGTMGTTRAQYKAAIDVGDVIIAILLL